MLAIGEVHRQLPFMFGDAEIAESEFDYLLDHSRYDFDLFCPPNLPLSTVDYAIALHASALVRDGGTLQIGIGELGDAIVYCLQLRHRQNPTWRQVLDDGASPRALRRGHRGNRRHRAVSAGSVRLLGDVRRRVPRPVSLGNPEAARVSAAATAAPAQ